MKVLILSSLVAAIAVSLPPSIGSAIVSQVVTLEFEKSTWVSHTFTHRRYTGGTGRREILS